MTRAIYELYGIVPNQNSNLYINLVPKQFSCNNFISGHQESYCKQTFNEQVILDNDKNGYKAIQWHFKQQNPEKQYSLNMMLIYSLSYIVTIHSDKINESIQTALNIVQKKLFLNDLTYIKYKLIQIFNLKKVMQLFRYKKSKIVYNMKTIINSTGKILIIDKLIITNKRVIVLTYKQIYDQSYFKQEIIKVLSNIYKNKKVNIYYLDLENIKLNIIE